MIRGFRLDTNLDSIVIGQNRVASRIWRCLFHNGYSWKKTGLYKQCFWSPLVPMGDLHSHLSWYTKTSCHGNALRITDPSVQGINQSPDNSIHKRPIMQNAKLFLCSHQWQGLSHAKLKVWFRKDLEEISDESQHAWISVYYPTVVQIIRSQNYPWNTKHVILVCGLSCT